MFNIVGATLIFILGLVIGSLLNCIIYRLEKGEGFLFSRSYCPHCKHILAWSDLIPVLSFIALRGKCRYCQKAISNQYPLVELTTAILFFLIFRHLNLGFNLASGIWSLDFLYLLIIASFLIIIFVYDLKHYIIPDKVIYPAIALTFLYHFFENLVIGHWDLIGHWSLVIGNLRPLLNPLLAATLAAGFFLLIVLVSHGRWMGAGDVKLAFLLGLLLGWLNVLIALFFAFLSGAIIGTGLVMTKKKTFRAEVPFGPFLVAGAFFALFFGGQVIHWYLDLFLW